LTIGSSVVGGGTSIDDRYEYEGGCYEYEYENRGCGTKTSMNILLLMMDGRKVIEQGITHTYIDLGSYGD
jgi:hypothetical protein